MRELKFRVWSEEDKQYRTDCKLMNLFTSPTGLPSTVYNDEGDRFDIEQYTGLKDKNGTEIYEGDIINAKVKGAWGSGSVAYLGFLEWKLRAYWDEARYAFMWHILGSKTQPDRVYDFYDDRVTEIEVIGNIHENPELLENEK